MINSAEQINVARTGDAPTDVIQQMAFGSPLAPKPGVRCTLFLLSPRETPDQFRRPLTYNFDNANLSEKVDDALRQSYRVGKFSMSDSMLLNDPNARQAILPSWNGDRVNLSNFNQYWTFVAIFESDTSVDPLGKVVVFPYRAIYSGWIMDEPVSPFNGALNPSAVLNFTHYIRLNECTRYTSGGTQKAMDTMADFDLVPVGQALANQTDGTSLFSLHPRTLMESYDHVDPATGMIVSKQVDPTSASLPNQANGDSIVLPTDLSSPTHHLGHVVTALVDAAREKDTFLQPNQTNRGSDTYWGPAIPGNSPRNQDINMYVDRVTNNLATMPDTQLENLPDPKMPITLNELMFKYGAGLNPVVIRQEYYVGYNVDNSASGSYRSVMSSVISAALPSIMATIGIADVQFRFNSGMSENGAAPVPPTMRDRGGRTDGMFQLLSLSTLYPCSADATQVKWQYFMDYLRTTVFPIVKEYHGDFDVMVHSSLSGATLVDLNYLSDGLGGQAYIETNNLLGGLNSPVVGGYSVFQQNGSNLASVSLDMAMATSMPDTVSANSMDYYSYPQFQLPTV